MMIKRQFAVIGGDLRNIKLAEILKGEGHTVKTYGFSKIEKNYDLHDCFSLSEAMEGADAVIGPIPCSLDNDTLNAPNHGDSIHMHDIFRQMSKNQLFFAGRISEKIHHMAQACSTFTIDLLDREEMAILNAIPTAEGAIQIAMEEMPITLHESSVMVLGFGRIGKILSRLLQGLGAQVFVAARKYSDLSWIRSYGYTPITYQDLAGYVTHMHLIVNTVPSMVLNEDLLKRTNRECVIIDLASKPGGVDFDKAGEIGLKVIWALSLPGKVAPVTAAKYIKETIYNVFEELGV